MLSLLLSFWSQCLNWKSLPVLWTDWMCLDSLALFARILGQISHFTFFLSSYSALSSSDILQTCHFQFYLVFSANCAGYKFSFTVFILHVHPHAGHRSRTYFTLDLPLWMRQNMGLQSMLVRIIPSQMEVAPLHYCSYHTEEKTIQEHKRDWKDVRGISRAPNVGLRATFTFNKGLVNSPSTSHASKVLNIWTDLFSVWYICVTENKYDKYFYHLKISSLPCSFCFFKSGQAAHCRNLLSLSTRNLTRHHPKGPVQCPVSPPICRLSFPVLFQNGTQLSVCLNC